VHPTEDVNCYASPLQRTILLQLADYPLISDRFFLTGGTALSVFYLHHRTSEDLDLFAVDQADLSEISFWIRTLWGADHAVVRSTTQFLSVLIREVKVDFVIDALSESGPRARWVCGEKSMMIDTLSNIAANNLCTTVSRMEPKDFIDFYILLKELPELSFEDLLEAARKREALLDDPPTAAFQLEDSIRFIRGHAQLLPRLKKSLDLEKMLAFYEDIAKMMYEKGRR
jgi:hypothetical protein